MRKPKYRLALRTDANYYRIHSDACLQTMLVGLPVGFDRSAIETEIARRKVKDEGVQS